MEEWIYVEFSTCPYHALRDAWRKHCLEPKYSNGMAPDNKLRNGPDTNGKIRPPRSGTASVGTLVPSAQLSFLMRLGLTFTLS